MKTKNTLKEIQRHAQDNTNTGTYLFEDTDQIKYLKKDLLKITYFLVFSLSVIFAVGLFASDLAIFNTLRDNFNIERINF